MVASALMRNVAAHIHMHMHMHMLEIDDSQLRPRQKADPQRAIGFLPTDLPNSDAQSEQIEELRSEL